MKMEFRDDEYIKATGNTPKGIGTWAFSDSQNPDPMKIKFFCGTLAEAKAQAKTHYKKVAEQNCETWMIIYILP